MSPDPDLTHRKATAFVPCDTPWVRHEGDIAVPETWRVLVEHWRGPADWLSQQRRPTAEELAAGTWPTIPDWYVMIGVVADDPGVARGATDYEQHGRVARARIVTVEAIYREVFATYLAQADVPEWVVRSAVQLASQQQGIQSQQSAMRQSADETACARGVPVPLRDQDEPGPHRTSIVRARRKLREAPVDYGLVMSVYRSAPSAPVRAVMEALGVSRSRASELVAHGKQLEQEGLVRIRSGLRQPSDRAQPGPSSSDRT